MNIAINKNTMPAGSRFLYRNHKNLLAEAEILEWSNSGKYLNLNHEWIMVSDLEKYVVVEILSSKFISPTDKL
jgi:hypothetical protein